MVLRECRKTKGVLNRAEKEYKKDPFNRNKKELLFTARKIFKRICRESEKNFRNKLTDMFSKIEGKNPKEFWNLIKKMQQWGKTNNNEADAAISPDSWLEHFQFLLNNGKEAPAELVNELESLENSPFLSHLDYKIQKCEIEKALKGINRKASPGVDNISGGLLYEWTGDLMATFNLFFQ